MNKTIKMSMMMTVMLSAFLGSAFAATGTTHSVVGNVTPTCEHGVGIFASQEQDWSLTKGIFPSKYLPFYLGNPSICGLEVYIPLNAINTGAETFNMTPIRQAIDLVKPYGQQVGIVIYTTGYSNNSKIYLAPYLAANVPIIPACGGGAATPDYLNSTFNTQYQNTIWHIIGTFQNNPYVSYFRFQTGVELAYSFQIYNNQTCVNLFQSYGINGSTWQNYALARIKFLGNQHSNRTVLFTLNQVPGLNLQTVGQAAINAGLEVGDQGNTGSCHLGGNPNAFNICNLLNANPGSTSFMQPLTPTNWTGQEGDDQFAFKVGPLYQLLANSMKHKVTLYELDQADILLADDPTYPNYTLHSANQSNALNITAAEIKNLT